ncbi:hypothetical protein BDF20DRAFT_876825 [Mycotypha africana]|uniref:uncharacterized protein n=1 Tax=Mycotypha africana TaxID=64632 RepID=UPI002301C97E|nr:uncharacterized protein BDF20DRAFT_876825 [Mycotypha africana]KAI8975083.1 hypothetical protein BDF20DRAFT_876825 [Mycotypha africana]
MPWLVKGKLITLYWLFVQQCACVFFFYSDFILLPDDCNLRLNPGVQRRYYGSFVCFVGTHRRPTDVVNSTPNV